MKKGNTAVHAEPRSTRRESNFPPSALSAPPREKKSRRHLSVFSFSNVRFSSVAGGADPGRGAERLTERLFGDESVDSNPCLEGCGLWANHEQPTTTSAFPGPSEFQLSAFPIMKKGNTAVHAEPRSTRRESNLPPSALSAPPREKKIRLADEN
jgi:hypothetical protein